MGEVWLAEEEGPHMFRRKVAIKRLHAAAELSQVATQSFFAEAQIIAQLDHPNIVRLIELGATDNEIYLVLDFVDGAPLNRIVKGATALSPKVVAYVGREVARALEAVHSLCDERGHSRGAVHRDVSPSNILVGRDGRVRLTDFGVARISGVGGDLTQAGVIKGKLPYIPPEQARCEPFDSRADVFALGITLCELLLGSRIRRAETQAQLIMQVATERVARVHEFAPHVPVELAHVIDRTTEFQAEARYRSGGEVADQLEEVLRSLGSQSEHEARHELKEIVANVAANALSGGRPIPTWTRTGSNRLSSSTRPPSSWPGFTPAERSQTPSQPFPSDLIQGGSDSLRTLRTSTSPPPSLSQLAPRPPAHGQRSPRRWLLAASGLTLVMLGGVLAARLSRPRLAAQDLPTTPPLVQAANSSPIVEATASTVASIVSAPSASPPSPPPNQSAAVAPRRPPPPPSPRRPSVSADTGEAGTLQVVVLPWADVTIDGRAVGTTPIAPVALTRGTHSIVLHNGELGTTRSVSVTIEPGKRSTVRLDLRRTTE